MKRLAILVLFTLPTVIYPADPAKPIVLAKDELAVLADRKSPDRKELFERYNGKLVRMDGRAYYNDGGRVGFAYFGLLLPGHKPADGSFFPSLKWSEDPSTQKIQDQLTDGKVLMLTIYGRFEKGNLLDASTDPTIAGLPYQAKEKPAARLKK